MSEERLSKLELLTNRLARRTVQTSRAILTPYPISNATFSEDVRGPILRYMFPCAGTITKGMVRLGAKPGDNTMVSVAIFGDTGGVSKDFVFDKALVSIEPGILVKSGDCLEIRLSSDEVIIEAWVSFLWLPSIDEVTVKSYLIDELDKLGNKNKLIGE